MCHDSAMLISDSQKCLRSSKACREHVCCHFTRQAFRKLQARNGIFIRRRDEVRSKSLAQEHLCIC